MDIDVIKSYLVSLGFAVDQPQLRQFQDTLRSMSASVERATTGTPFGMAGLFVKAGAAAVGALASVATGAVGLMNHVAQSDLGFQLYARRMFMATDAARAMKIATDALGVSIEDIVWGPKELAQRFSKLVDDQRRMVEGMGGEANYEKQMRQIRDVTFEFTRMKVELKLLSMSVVKDLSVALFGDEGSLQSKLHDFNEWVITHLPEISRTISDKLVPVIRDMGEVLKDVGHILMTIDWKRIADDMVMISHALAAFFDFLAAHPLAQKMILGAIGGGIAGSIIPGLGTGAGIIGGAALGAVEQGGEEIGAFGHADRGKKEPWNPGSLAWWLFADKAQIKEKIRKKALEMGLDPAIALGVAEKETGFDQSARGKAGEVGVFQLMPGTARSLGVDPSDLDQNIQGGISYLLQLYGRFHDWQKAITAYNGKGPMARAYAEDVLGNRIPRYQPQSYAPGGGGGVNVGGVVVHITEPHATKEQIYQATVKAVDDRLSKRDKRNLIQHGQAYA
jgi:Transglycosylase SLT domain